MSELNFISMTEGRLAQLLERASTMGAHKAMQLSGVAEEGDLVKRSSLVKKFERGKVDRMIKSGKVTPHKIDGGRVRYSVQEFLSYMD